MDPWQTSVGGPPKGSLGRRRWLWTEQVSGGRFGEQTGIDVQRRYEFQADLKRRLRLRNWAPARLDAEGEGGAREGRSRFRDLNSFYLTLA